MNTTTTSGTGRETQAVRSARTRDALLRAARELFAEKGFAATGREEIALRAGVTRGALYHHFADKQALFEAVYCEAAEELNTRARSAALAQYADSWAQITGAFKNYLELLASDPAYQRILLIDAPAALGWSRWRELQSQYIAQDTARALRLLMREGIMVQRPADPLANLIQAALNDAALSLAYAPDPRKASIEICSAFIFLLSGLRAAGH